ncbi:MAG: dockerin type I domain-containing protein [Candidatus Poribacteria bacterium]|nr:dockerin type I domain-containing protein [Candidatus Poribacteria bacterium]
MKKITYLFLTTCLILTHLSVGYTQDAELDTLKASDINADGMVNILDLTLVAAHFGTTPTADQTPNPDVNGDGSVNILDLTLVASHLGKTIRPPVAFVSANPTIDSLLTVDDTITLTFDNMPDDVRVNTGVATVIDKTVKITGPFTPGSVELTITWADGNQTLNYTIRPPAVFVSANPAVQSEITVDDTITLTFDNPPEDVTISTGTATVTDKTVEIVGPFDPGALALSITWTDGSQTLNYTIRPPAAFVSANPAVRSEIAVDDTITLTFDNPPEDVTVSTGDATTIGKRVRITGPFDSGALTLTVTWADGSQTLTYTVEVPDTEAPEITSGTVNAGDKDVDPDALNSSGRIEVEFSERVTGNIALQTVAGVDAGWLGKVDGKKGTLELVKGKELDNEITYIIAGKVEDAAGNSTDINLRFTTAPKTSGIPFAVTDATFNSLVLNSEIPIVVEFVKDG